MQNLPIGTVTFLMTDVQGSTRLWEQDSDAMSEALVKHDSILTNVIRRNGGDVVKSRGEGDSLFAIFRQATDAVIAAVSIQMSLQYENWPTSSPLLVRMALHTGEAILRENDYYGTPVIRCARLRAITHGGQVTLSQVTAELVRNDLPAGVTLLELGSHQLKDLQHPEYVYQIIHPDLRSGFPPLSPIDDLEENTRPHLSSFVGRDAEMKELMAAFEDTRAGRGRIVMLVGEPGVGKTRIAQEFATKVGQTGAQILWGTCFEGEGAPSYWPWIQVIREYLKGFNSKEMDARLGHYVNDLAAIIPEMRGQLMDLQSQTTSEAPEDARFRLFDAIITLLKDGTTSHPLVVVLEDLHCADEPSLLLLELLSQQLANSRILLVGTYRDVGLNRRHPLHETLGALAREGSFRRLNMTGLTGQDIARLVERRIRFKPSSDLVQTVYQRTEGNPFFVHEVVQLLIDEGTLTQNAVTPDMDLLEQQVAKIPHGVREAIGRRLNRLSDQCLRMLTTASIIGREFEFVVLRQLLDGDSAEELLDAIDEAIGLQVISETSDDVHQYRFTHALIQETLASELSTARRIRTHAKIATILERVYADVVEEHASALAYHFAQSKELLKAEELERYVRYSAVAGENALSIYAYEDALQYFQQSLDAKTQLSSSDSIDGQTAGILFGLARSQAAILRQLQEREARDALTSLSQALDYYINADELDRAVSVAECPFPPIIDSSELARNIERVLPLVSSDSHQEARLLSRYGRLIGNEEGRYSQAQEAFERALMIAQREDDSVLQMQTLAHSARVDMENQNWQGSLEKSILAVELATRVDDTRALLEAQYRAAFALHIIGDLEKCAVHANASLALADELRDRYWLTNSLWINELVFRLRGDWEAAAVFSDRSLEIWPRDPRLLATRSILEHESGQTTRGESYMHRLIDVMHDSPMGSNWETANFVITASLIACMTGKSDQLELAERAAKVVLDSDDITPGMADQARGGLALIAVHRKDQGVAREQYSALQYGSGKMLFGFASITGDRLLGLLAMTAGDLTRAINHFRDGLRFSRSAGYRPEYAWCATSCATALIERDENGDDRVQAVELLNEALVIATELDMIALTDKLALERETIGAARLAPAEYPDGLTEREVQVLRLIASGKSNRDIGEELLISFNTVARHVSNIFNKTGSANRVEATLYANRNRFISRDIFE